MALVVLSRASSTMDVAREMLKLGEVTIVDPNRTEPGGVLALDQTAGRGQRGRTWYSAPGESLCATYFVPLTDESYRDAGQMAIVAGVAVARALTGMFSSNDRQQACSPDTVETAHLRPTIGLKWPNDIEIGGKKLGGILVEIVSYPRHGMIALIGVGINVGVSQFPANLAQTSTSLAIEDANPISLLTLAKRIDVNLQRTTADRIRDGFVAIMAAWRPFDTTAGRSYSTDTGGGSAIGVAEGVDSDGALIIRTNSGEIITVLSASVTNTTVASQ